MADVAPQSDVHPGPYLTDIIAEGTAHRAHSIFYGYISGDQLVVRRCDKAFWDHRPIPEQVLHYIRIAGFEGVLLCGYQHLDHALITSLVERWRPETHTFHLPVGEATVTLQDVEVIWGLRIDGPPVTGVDVAHTREEWRGICAELLGFSPDPTDFDGGRLRVSCLSTELDRALPANATDDTFRQRARVYILLLLGGHLFSDKSGNKLSLMWLPLLRDLETLGEYSWGSAVLSFLYRSLCTATLPAATDIAGPLLLL